MLHVIGRLHHQMLRTAGSRKDSSLIEVCPSSAASHVRKALIVVEVTPLSSLETPHSREDLPRNRRDTTALLSSTCSGYAISSSDPLEYALKSIIGGTKYLPSISSACRFPVNMAFDMSLICGGVPAGALQLPALDIRLFRGWISTCALICGEFFDSDPRIFGGNNDFLR